MTLSDEKVSDDGDDMFEKVYDDGRITLEKVSNDGDDIFENFPIMQKTYLSKLTMIVMTYLKKF